MQTKQLLLATRSHGKFPEIVTALNGLPLQFMNLNDISQLPSGYEVEEPASSFEGNAIIKAMTLGYKTGLLTLADDSGLEVDALGGRPGVYSARYAPGSDEDRRNKLLAELKDVPEPRRTARFRAFIAIFDPATCKIRTCSGTYEGRITNAPVGSHGFGYDPIFFSVEKKKTSSEMTVDEKNSVSHRGVALREARKIIAEVFLPPE
jgi:XTP/dITP diphosphohydrolase